MKKRNRCDAISLRLENPARRKPFHADRQTHPSDEVYYYLSTCFFLHIAAPLEGPSDTLSARLIRSWARHRLVAASSRSTEEKVVSRSGSGRHWRRASRARLLSLNLSHPLVNRGRLLNTGHSPQETTDNMLEQSYGLLFDQLSHHIAEDRSNGVKALVGRADIGQANVVQKNLLHDENSHCLAQLRPSLHDTETERDNLGREEEVDHIRGIVLHKRTDHAQRSETEIFERTGFGSRIEEGIQEQRDVG